MPFRRRAADRRAAVGRHPSARRMHHKRELYMQGAFIVPWAVIEWPAASRPEKLMNYSIRILLLVVVVLVAQPRCGPAL